MRREQSPSLCSVIRKQQGSSSAARHLLDQVSPVPEDRLLQLPRPVPPGSHYGTPGMQVLLRRAIGRCGHDEWGVCERR